jgi:hypothetical protein
LDAYYRVKHFALKNGTDKDFVGYMEKAIAKWLQSQPEICNQLPGDLTEKDIVTDIYAYSLKTKKVNKYARELLKMFPKLDEYREKCDKYASFFNTDLRQQWDHTFALMTNSVVTQSFVCDGQIFHALMCFDHEFPIFVNDLCDLISGLVVELCQREKIISNITFKDHTLTLVCTYDFQMPFFVNAMVNECQGMISVTDKNITIGTGNIPEAKQSLSVSRGASSRM